MTERLYENDPYLKEFEAKVTVCEEKNGSYHICLDRSAFFPEGGGQPGDRGWIASVPIFDTHEKEGRIWHYAKQSLEVGMQVECRLDWDFRFSNMQNHAGEHIVSGLIHQKYGYDNVGFHMGSDAITLDMNGILTYEQVIEIEREANQTIEANVLINSYIPDKDALKLMMYRSKKEIEGDVRIVEIPGYDQCACCGTHPFRTGEIRLIKILSVQNYKGGVRISMLAGRRALEDYHQKHESVVKISRMLSAKTGEVADAVEHLLKEMSDLKFTVVQMKREMMAAKAAQQVIEGDRLCVLASEFQGNELREYATLLSKRVECVLALSEGSDGAFRYVLIDGNNQAKTYAQEMRERFQGKGGGSNQMIQGTLKGQWTEIQQWFEHK